MSMQCSCNQKTTINFFIISINVIYIQLKCTNLNVQLMSFDKYTPE